MEDHFALPISFNNSNIPATFEVKQHRYHGEIYLNPDNWYITGTGYGPRNLHGLYRIPRLDFYNNSISGSKSTRVDVGPISI